MEEFLLALYRKTNCKIGHVVDSDKEIEKLVVIDSNFPHRMVC
jgi:hypothetical protein